jgi:hypothetical protein
MTEQTEYSAPEIPSDAPFPYDDVAMMRADISKVYAQTTWLCRMVTAIRATLPPPMQQALDGAFAAITTETET